MKTQRKYTFSLVILTRNEIVGLRSVIRKIPFEEVDDFFAIDFQSTDGTVDFFSKHGIPVMQQKKRGRGEAFRLAYNRTNRDVIIFFSPDGNENPADIPKLIYEIERGSDLVIASRFLPQSRNEEDDFVFKPRKWANQGFTLLANLLWKGKVSDSINGYRAITKTAFNKLHLNAGGFSVEYQMTIRALKAGLKIKEIPTIEGNRISGQSTATALPTGLIFIKLLISEILIGNRF